MSSSIPGFWAVIPAGGAGTRLWPMSRAKHPKFLLDLTGSGRTLIQGTVDRLRPLADDRFLIVTGKDHRDAVIAQLPEVEPGDVLAEPSPRDSAAAIGLAAAALAQRDPDAIMGSFAADHVIRNPERFADCVRVAVEVARQDKLVTIGIEPTFPSTGFGYIRLGEALDVPGAYTVQSFVEKPSAEVAALYLQTGQYRWNAGMFVAKASVLLELLERYHPSLARRVREIAAAPERLTQLWPSLEKIAIDHAVAEPAADDGRVAVVPGSFGWDDVGDFASLASILPPSTDGPTVIGDIDRVHSIDSAGLILSDTNRAISVVGLKDIVVVDTADALLVTTLERAQDVKKMVDRLKDDGLTDLL